MYQVGSSVRPAGPWASWDPPVPTPISWLQHPDDRHTAVSGFESVQGIQNDLLGLGAHQPLSYGFSPRTFNFFPTLPTLSFHQPWSNSAFPGKTTNPQFLLNSWGSYTLPRTRYQMIATPPFSEIHFLVFLNCSLLNHLWPSYPSQAVSFLVSQHRLRCQRHDNKQYREASVARSSQWHSIIQ